MPTSTRFRPRATVVVALLLAFAALSLGCAPEEESLSRSEYLELVHGWLERDTTIREQAFAATNAESNEPFLELKAEVDELRADVESVPPPEGFETLQENFVECEEHFSAALELLGSGEAILAIDELALSKDARLRMKDELEQLDAADI